MADNFIVLNEWLALVVFEDGRAYFLYVNEDATEVKTSVIYKTEEDAMEARAWRRIEWVVQPRSLSKLVVAMCPGRS